MRECDETEMCSAVTRVSVQEVYPSRSPRLKTIPWDLCGGNDGSNCLFTHSLLLFTCFGWYSTLEKCCSGRVRAPVFQIQETEESKKRMKCEIVLTDLSMRDNSRSVVFGTAFCYLCGASKRKEMFWV